MNGKAHAVIGAVTWLTIHPHLDPTLIGAVVGSLIPDSDTPKAPAGKIIPAWIFCKHRGVTHSVQALVVVSCIVGCCFGYWGGFSFAVGYLMHLICDATTPSGVRWWWTRRKATSRR